MNSTFIHYSNPKLLPLEDARCTAYAASVGYLTVKNNNTNLMIYKFVNQQGRSRNQTLGFEKPETLFHLQVNPSKEQLLFEKIFQ